eukprot:3843738-Pyramimonas_sp.AAC.1
MKMRAALNAAALSLVSERKPVSEVQNGAVALASLTWARATRSTPTPDTTSSVWGGRGTTSYY